ncbi:MAG: ABC transporter ATP-binding protein [Chloroflexi bacterium]|nr:ABC transporter ATP-binding protein [Chloroflexota bacterium]
MTPVLELDGLVKEFPMGRRGGVVHAVNGVSLAIAPGETLGVVGESGSGKSTLGRMALRLLEPTQGRIRFEGQDITRLGGGALRAWRARAQVVFQDPRDALSPRMDVRTLIEEPLRLHTDLDATARLERVVQLLRSVRLDEGYLTRSPRRLSGGEAQRVAIARALATDPTFLVLDEPTSSLDLHVRRSILTLLDTLQQERGLTYLLISHDLHMVAAHADQVAVMYLGRIVETGPAREVFEHPEHPYTQALLSATLSADPTVRPSRILLQGEIPSPIDLPPGCLFASRCPIALDACRTAPPEDRSVGPGHSAACIRIDDRTNRLRTARPAAPRAAALMEASI